MGLNKNRVLCSKLCWSWKYIFRYFHHLQGRLVLNLSLQNPSTLRSPWEAVQLKLKFKQPSFKEKSTLDSWMPKKKFKPLLNSQTWILGLWWIWKNAKFRSKSAWMDRFLIKADRNFDSLMTEKIWLLTFTLLANGKTTFLKALTQQLVYRGQPCDYRLGK